MRSTGASSLKYGPCEVCMEHAAEVWIGTPDNGYSHVFGHRSCVEKAIHDPKLFEKAEQNSAKHHGVAS
ncbi:MAG: hypothetical protein PVSMB1_04930 [Gemmatimonadaceae bacterium]